MTTDMKHLDVKLQKLKRLIELLPTHLCTEDKEPDFDLDYKLVDNYGMPYAFEDCMRSQLDIDSDDEVQLRTFSRSFHNGDLMYTFKDLRDYAKDEMEGCYLTAITWIEKITVAVEKATDADGEEGESSDPAPAKVKKRRKAKKGKHKRTSSAIETTSDNDVQEIKEDTMEFKRLKARSSQTSLGSSTASLPPESSEGEVDSALDDDKPTTKPFMSSLDQAARQRLASRPQIRLDKTLASNPTNLPPSQSAIHSFLQVMTDPVEIAAQRQRRFDEIDAMRKAVAHNEQMGKARKAQKKRDDGMQRQKKYRARHKGGEDESPEAFKTLVAASQSTEFSRPKLPKKKTKSKRVNYFHPLIFPKIESAIKAHDWQDVSAVVRDLKKEDRVFTKLHRTTVGRWIAKGKDGTLLRRFVPWVCDAIKAGCQRGRGGRTGILHEHPQVIQEFKNLVKGLRKNGQPVDSGLMRGHLVTLIHLYAPTVLDDNHFVCTDRFVRSILADKFGMSYRKWTKAAKKTPTDWESICKRAVFRITKVARDKCVPLELLVNMDQTGVLFEPGLKYTYEEVGAKQVPVAGKDAKRAYTLCVTSSAAGDFLPMQQICSGKTSASCPSRTSDGMDEAKAIGFDFTFTGKQSHYSTFETMKRYINTIIVPYRDRQLEAHPEWPRSTPMILLLDCYPVHTGKDFSAFIKSEFPYIILLYIPANCTGLFQPADVGLQRFLKHFICKFCIERRIAWQVQQVREHGIALSDIVHSDSIKVLRDATVRAMVELHKFMISDNGRSVVRKAWEKCVADGFSLASVTSPETRLALEDYLMSPEGDILNDEILAAQRRRALPVSEANSTNDDACEAPFDEQTIHSDMPEDDLAAPSHVIIADSLGLQISSTAFDNTHSIPEHLVGIAADPLITGFSSVDQTESVYNYDISGNLFATGSTDDEGDDGEVPTVSSELVPERPKRKVTLRVDEGKRKVILNIKAREIEESMDAEAEAAAADSESGDSDSSDYGGDNATASDS